MREPGLVRINGANSRPMRLLYVHQRLVASTHFYQWRGDNRQRMIQHIQERLQLARFIWADKVALIVGFLFSSLLLCFWSFAFLLVGNLGAKHMWKNFGILGVELEILAIGSTWFVMRVTDFLAGGTTCQLFDDKSGQKNVDVYTPERNEQQPISGSILPANQSAAIE